MKVLITGATGLVGTALTELLLQNGIKINYLTTSKSKIARQPEAHPDAWIEAPRPDSSQARSQATSLETCRASL